MGILVGWIITTIAIIIVAYLLPGIRVASLGSALIAAAILGIVNAFLKPILVLLTLPLTIVTFGLFLLVINALLFWLVGSIVPGFVVKSFWWAVAGSIIISFINYVLYSLL